MTPFVVKNKPETERDHVVTGVADGWEKTSLNSDPNEILTESRGLDILLTECNLQADGKTKIDPSKPIGKEVIIDIYDPDAIPVTTVTLSPDPGAGTVGTDITFTADILPADATYKDVEWSSSDESKATSKGNGVFGLLAAGTGIIISATSIDGGIVGEVELNITAANVAVTGVTVAPTTKSLAVGATQQLTPTVAPAGATDKTVTYTSSATGIATVSASGLVTAVSVGTANITVKTNDGNKTAVCAVTVTPVAVTGVTIAPKTASIAVGATQQLTPTVAPAGATNKAVTYGSSATGTATVNASGLVTGVAAGTATITVTTADGSKTDTAVITVTAP